MPKIMILDKNETLGEDNNVWSWKDILKKIDEESTELTLALCKEDKANIAEETLDLIQLCAGVLDKLEREGTDIDQEFLKHEKKLINRKWKSKGIIDIKVQKFGRV